MNPFLNSILESYALDITEPVLRIEGGIDSNISGFLFFNAYESSKYPEVPCDKDYFFIYSTDHSNTGGKINWGKGNNLNLTDFQEVATIRSGFQCESAILLRIPSNELPDNEVLHLFFHTNSSEPENNSYQQTRLITSEGGIALHLMDWTDRGRPLGLESNENHTGYFYPYRIAPNNYLGTHITKGGVPQPWYFSTSTDGRNWSRGNEYDARSFVTYTGGWVKPSYGKFFDKYNQQWWLGTLETAQYNEDLVDVKKQLVLAKTDGNFQITEIVKILNYGNYTRNHSAKIEDDTAHIYIEFPSPSDIYYSAYDLRNLQSYL